MHLLARRNCSNSSSAARGTVHSLRPVYDIDRLTWPTLRRPPPYFVRTFVQHLNCRTSAQTGGVAPNVSIDYEVICPNVTSKEK